jgi:hypothetical protein
MLYFVQSHFLSIIYSYFPFFFFFSRRRLWQGTSVVLEGIVWNETDSGKQQQSRRRTGKKERERKIPVVIVVVVVRQNNSLRICAEISAINIQTKQMP